MRRLPWLIAACGIALRLIPSFRLTWYDENFSILLSRLPLPQLIQATAGDVHPPLWYLICWMFTHLGLPGDIAVRLPALLFSLLCIPLFWTILDLESLGRITLLSPRFRLVAFTLFCLLPTQIAYAQEGRQYSLLTLLVLLAWLAILRRKWFLLGISTALMLWLHNYGLLYAASLWLAGMAHDRDTWKELTLSIAAAGLTFVPWLFVLFGQMGAIDGNYWMVQLSAASVMLDFSEAVMGNGTLPIEMVTAMFFWLMLTWCLLWSLRTRAIHPPTVILAFAPLLMAAIVSVVWQPIMLARALIPSGAFVCILLAYPIEYLAAWRPRLFLARLILVPTLVLCLLATLTRPQWAQASTANTFAAIQLIDREWQPGDLLFHVDDGIFVSGAANWTTVDSITRLAPCGVVRGSLTPRTRLAIGERTGILSRPPEGRLWVLTAETPLNSNCETNYLRSHGLLKSKPLYCLENDQLVRACLYLVKGTNE